MSALPKSYRPLALIGSDLHLSTLQPVCRREDDWLAAQWRVLQSIRTIWQEAKIKTDGALPIILAGDIFDVPCPDLPLIQMFQNWKGACWGQVHSVPGQHDLRHHRISDVGSTGYGFAMLSSDLCGIIQEDVDDERGSLYYRYPANEREPEPALELSPLGEDGSGPAVYGFGWNQSGNSENFLLQLEEQDARHNIAITHEHVHAGDETKHEGEKQRLKDQHARNLAKEFKSFEFVFCGDNHTPFEFQPAVGPMIINCGALQCRTIKQREFVPSMVLLCEDKKRGELVAVRINLPVDENAWAPESVLTLLEKHQTALLKFDELSEEDVWADDSTLYSMLQGFLTATHRGRMLEDLTALLKEA